MKKFAWLALALSATLLLVAACGGGDDDDDGDDSDSPAELTENDLAEAMLLILEDLPADEGWSFSPDDSVDDEENPLSECDDGDDPGLIGKADGGDFTNDPGGILEVSQDIRIFETDEQLIAAIENVEDYADCVGDRINDGALDNEDAKFSDFKFDDLDFTRFGDRTKAYRMTITATEANPTAGNDPETAAFYIDQVFVAVGTVGMRVQGSSIFDPYPAEELEAFIALGETKIRDVLADPPASGGATSSPGETDEPEDTSTDEPATPTSQDSTPPPNAGGVGSSKDNPVPFGQDGVILGRMQLKVTSVDFDAEDDVLAFNSFNEATPGKNMVVMTVDIINIGTEPLDVFFDPFWNLVGAKNIEYDEFDPSCGVVENELDGEVASGGSITGTVCVQADEDDSNLVFFVEMFNEDFDIERVYLALQ